MYVLVWIYVHHMQAGSSRGQKMASGPLELDLWATIELQVTTWGLENEVMSSARAISAFDSF